MLNIMKYIQVLFFLSLVALSFDSLAVNVDCVSLVNKEQYKVNLNKPNFVNCMQLSSLNPNKPLAITVFSNDRTTSSINISGLNNQGVATKISQHKSNADGIMVIKTLAHTNWPSLALTLSSLNRIDQDKNLLAFYSEEDTIHVLTLVIASVTKAPPSYVIDPGTGYCDPNTRICTRPQSIIDPKMTTHTTASSKACTETLAPPEKMPENFDLKEHAKYFSAFNTAVNAISFLPGQEESIKQLVIVALFAPHSVYDVKNGSVFKGGEKAGNYILGYLASTMDFSQTHVVRLGAVAQQFQNLSSTRPLYPQFGEFYSGMKLAMSSTPQQADNAGDSKLIENGFLAEQSGCNMNQKSTTSTTGSGEGGAGSGWSSSGIFFGLSGCYGNCGQGLIPKVTIKDIPR